MKSLLCIAFLFVYSAATHPSHPLAAPSAVGVSVTGVVQHESSGRPVADAEILIGGTMLRARTDHAGRFVMTKVPVGTLDVVVILSQARQFTTAVEVRNQRGQNFEIMVPDQSAKAPASYDPEKIIDKLKRENAELRQKLGMKTRPAETNSFQEYVIGVSRDCVLLNPEALTGAQEKRKEGLWETFTSSDPLLVDNLALGYRLQIFLNKAQVWTTSKGRNMNYDAVIAFSDLNPKNQKEQNKWLKNRSKVYKGSLRHFLSSLAGGRLAEDGFMVATSSEDDPLVGSPGVPGYYNSGGSRFVPRQNPYFIVSQSGPDEHQLDFSSVIEVTYLRDFIPSKYHGYQNIVDDRQVSLLALNRRPVAFNSRGIPQEEDALQKIGYWGVQQICDMLPMSYVPEPQ